MLTLSSQVGELLLQATQSQDLEEALQKVLRDYVDLKLAALSAEIEKLHGYEVPEVLALPIVEGSSNYLNWLDVNLLRGAGG